MKITDEPDHYTSTYTVDFNKNAVTIEEALGQLEPNPAYGPTMFSGYDLNAYINGKKVNNLESVTWSESVEVWGDYDEVTNELLGWRKGKRVIVGSLMLSQFREEPLLQHFEGESDVLDLPAFDLAIVGMINNQQGVAVSDMRIEGIEVTQKTGGFTSSDLGNTVGYSFVAYKVVPWTRKV